MKSIDAYRMQKRHAKRRGVEFALTYEQWLYWWGEDLPLRGRGIGKLQMCRFMDTGPYALHNIYKSTHEENSSFKFKLGFKGRKPITTPEIAEDVRLYLDLGASTREAAKRFDLSQKTVMRIKHKVSPYNS